MTKMRRQDGTSFAPSIEPRFCSRPSPTTAGAVRACPRSQAEPACRTQVRSGIFRPSRREDSSSMKEAASRVDTGSDSVSSCLHSELSATPTFGRSRSPTWSVCWSASRRRSTLAVFRQRRLVIIDVLDGLRSIRQGVRIGEQDQLRSTALGKAILASYPDDKALALLRSEPLKRCTSRTISNDKDMLRELRAIRSRGYAVDNEEHEIGLRCLGVAIRHRRDQAFGLSISGPTGRLTREVVREAGAVLNSIAQDLATRIEAQGSSLI